MPYLYFLYRILNMTNVQSVESEQKHFTLNSIYPKFSIILKQIIFHSLDFMLYEQNCYRVQTIRKVCVIRILQSPLSTRTFALK